MEEIRTTRRYGVTAQMTNRARQNLFHLRQDREAWDDLLDVMEQAVIELETNLINTAPEDTAAILEKHKLCKAAWQIFEHLQTKVEQEIAILLTGHATALTAPPLSDEEREIEEIITPYATNSGEMEDSYNGL
jgi:hypothetical protein